MDPSSFLRNEEFSRPTFQPETFADERFTELPVERVRLYTRKLRESKALIGDELKNRVYQQYRVFIDAAKEIAGMEQEVVLLGNLLDESTTFIDKAAEMNFTNEISGHYPGTLQPLPKTRSELPDALQDLLEVPYEIDVALACREFSRSFSLLQQAFNLLYCAPTGSVQYLALNDENHERRIQKARRIAESITPSQWAELDISALNKELLERRRNLIDALFFALRNPSFDGDETRLVIQLLIELGKKREAQTVFLETCSFRLLSEIKKLKFQGDVTQYTDDIAFISFSMIQSTATEFQKLFIDQVDYTLLVNWATAETESCAELLCGQIFLSDVLDITCRCIQLALHHVEKLRDTGLTLEYHFRRLFLPNLRKAIRSALSKSRSSLSSSLRQDYPSYRFLEIRDSNGSKKILALTSGVRALYSIVSMNLHSLGRIFYTDIYPDCMGFMKELFETYSQYLVHTVADRLHSWSDQDIFIVLGSLRHIFSDLIPRIQNLVQEWSGIHPSDIEEMALEFSSIERDFLMKIVHRLVRRCFQSAQKSSLDNPQPRSIPPQSNVDIDFESDSESDSDAHGSSSVPGSDAVEQSASLAAFLENDDDESSVEGGKSQILSDAGSLEDEFRLYYPSHGYDGTHRAEISEPIAVLCSQLGILCESIRERDQKKQALDEQRSIGLGTSDRKSNSKFAEESVENAEIINFDFASKDVSDISPSSSRSRRAAVFSERQRSSSVRLPQYSDWLPPSYRSSMISIFVEELVSHLSETESGLWTRFTSLDSDSECDDSERKFDVQNSEINQVSLDVRFLRKFLEPACNFEAMQMLDEIEQRALDTFASAYSLDEDGLDSILLPEEKFQAAIEPLMRAARFAQPYRSLENLMRGIS